MTRVTFVGSFPAADFHLSPPLPEIAFLGRSNVGKSSLLNAVCGARALARVSKTPGKTRAANVFKVDDRWYLVDLPGYGFARAPQRQRSAFHHLLVDYVGGRRSLAAVVWLLDVRREPTGQDLTMSERLAARAVPVLAAITKLDKITRSERPARIRAILEGVGLPEDQCVPTSVRTGEGIQDLRDSIAALVAGRRPGAQALR